MEDLSTPSDWQRFHLSFNRTLSRERADGDRSGLTMYGENNERFDRISMTDLQELKWTKMGLGRELFKPYFPRRRQSLIEVVGKLGQDLEKIEEISFKSESNL